MDEIVVKRQKGFLDLNEYFNNVLGINVCRHDLQTLYEKGLIEVETTGLSDKFWIIDPITTRKIALFKEQSNLYTCYSELFSEEIAKILDFETAHYDLAVFNGYQGVISYNFLKNEENYLSGFDVLNEYFEEKIFMDQKIIEELREKYIKNPPEGMTAKLVKNMVIAIEPMVNMGERYVQFMPDGWTCLTRDRLPSAHYENTVLITEDGVEILTL